MPADRPSHSGAYSATGVGNLEMRQNFAPVRTPDIGQLGFWVTNPNAFDALIGYELFYADDPNPALYLDCFVQPLPQTGWTYIDMTRHLREGADLVGIGIIRYDRTPDTPTPRLYVDDVVSRIGPGVPEPGAFALVGAGLPAVLWTGARRQRRG